jgi:hypothetical protein
VRSQPVVTKNHTTAAKRPSFTVFRWVNQVVSVTGHRTARTKRSRARRSSSPTESAQNTTKPSVTSARTQAVMVRSVLGYRPPRSRSVRRGRTLERRVITKNTAS